ncbi:MAG: PorP/SprF family type IX secretion system membrane protein [Flavobacteriales bacterium]|nr:PorP/SprF family type IX secretion system membrane protein [Flavobacteriales bacterium]
MNNNRLYKTALTLVISITGSVGAFAQDIHFSQFSSAPLTLNPGSTGAFEGDVRAVVNFKDQWRTIANPYKTLSFSVDAPLLKDVITDGAISGGIAILSDKAGDLDVGTTQFNLFVAANKSIDRQNNISLGISGGFAQWAMDGDAETQRWDSEYDPGASGGYTNSDLGSTNTENFNYVDFSTGLLWNYLGDIKAHAGISLFHLNKPQMSFINDPAQLNAKLAFHGGAEIYVKGATVSVLPQLLFLKQGPQTEFNIGGLVKYRLREGSRYTGEIEETAVYLGGWYRFGDAFILNARFDYMRFALGVSYDVNVSGINVATASKGGLEISLMFMTPGPVKRKTASPLM